MPFGMFLYYIEEFFPCFAQRAGRGFGGRRSRRKGSKIGKHRGGQRERCVNSMYILQGEEIGTRSGGGTDASEAELNHVRNVVG